MPKADVLRSPSSTQRSGLTVSGVVQRDTCRIAWVVTPNSASNGSTRLASPKSGEPAASATRRQNDASRRFASGGPPVASP